VTYVVDGQQRLTSIMLLLIACRMQAHHLELGSLKHAIQQKITFVDSSTAESLGCRFISSESIRDLFEYMAVDTWKGDFPSRINKKQIKRQINRIKPIFEFFLNQIAYFKQSELSQFLKAIYNSYVIQIQVNNDEEALSIFERTNARGLDLEVSDLLKNYLFSQRVMSIEDKWKEILANADGTILRMLKYFYVSRLGYVSKSQLYRKIKEYADRQEIGPERFTVELVEFSRFYYLTKDPTAARTRDYFEGIGFDEITEHEDRIESISASLQALKEFGVVQFCPVGYAFIDSIKRMGEFSKSNARVLIRLFENFENYHFVNTAICQRLGNEVEHLYTATCTSLIESNDVINTTSVFYKNLRELIASWDEFKGRFTEISYNSDNMSIIYYVFDRINNIGLQPAQRLKIYNPDSRILRKANNIEHFMPQHPPEEIGVDNDTKEFIDNIGNLLPIYHRTNSKLGNLSPAEKVVKLRGEWRNEIQNSPFVIEFLEKYGDKADNWNAQTIRERAIDLAELSFKKIWVLNT
jgi:hypothetical protein